MLLEDINPEIHVRLGNRVYLAEDVHKLFDVRNVPYEDLE